MIEFAPTGSEVTEYEAEPELSSTADPRNVVPAPKVTVPEGTEALPDVTLAVTTKGEPKTALIVDAVRVVTVAARSKAVDDEFDDLTPHPAINESIP